jgi:PAS domain-containing protein
MIRRNSAEASVDRSFVNALFYEEPAGTFSDGYVFRAEPDLTGAQQDPDNGYWHCDVSDHDRLTWSEKVYELFGLPAGTPIDRRWAVAQYSEKSKTALERVRSFGLNRDFGFILDAEIMPEGGERRWIRVLAVPILKDGRVAALHGLKRAI